MQKRYENIKIRVSSYLKYRFSLYYLMLAVSNFVRYYLEMINTTNYLQSTLSSSQTKTSYSLWFSNIYDFGFYPVLYPLRKKGANEIQFLGLNSVIDMCCGTGNQLKYLKYLGITKVSGIDISKNMFAKAKRNGVVEFCQKRDATNTGFIANSYEGVLLSFVLHETSESQTQKIVDESIRITKRSGKIIIVDYIFDKKIKFIGKYLCILTEWLIGGEYYKIFSKYIKQNLIKGYTKELTLINEYKSIFNSVCIQIYSINT